ncbi:MAG TPA: hypothetical protein PLH94_09590 [Fimbriimonadaceae bacterium]|nr:hypothetical protein [Fimbriimonadaceae bacterium]
MLALLASYAFVGQLTEPGAFGELFDVREPIRLALTPKMDGQMEPEEWDPLSSSGGLESWMQWEPGVLYLAGKAATGRDIVWSLDLRGDGWLVGRDNLEIRAAWGPQGPIYTARLLDATQRNGPIWEESPLLEGMLQMAGNQTADSWLCEIKLLALFLPYIGESSKLALRGNAIESGGATPAAYVPRRTFPLTMSRDRNRGLPIGMEWVSEYVARSVVPGDSIRIRLNFTNPNRTARFDRIELRMMGLLKDSTTSTSKPFPSLNRRGRGFVDYETDVASTATTGYRVMQGKLTDANGQEAIVETSFLVAPAVVFDVNLPMNTTVKQEGQTIAGSVTIRSQTRLRVDGEFSIEVPEGWTAPRGGYRKFIIYSSRGSQRVGLQLVAPQGAQGAFPITFKAKIGDSVVQTTILLPIRPKAD